MKYIKPIRPSQARGRLREIYEDINTLFPGPVPKPYLALALASDYLDAFWQATKETYFGGEFIREYKDVIAHAVSAVNQCSFCLEAHSQLAEKYGEEVLPKEMRNLVNEQILAWHGEVMPLDTKWVDKAIASLNHTQKTLAYLALMTALASYRVDQKTTDAFNRVNPDDASIVKTVIWASFQVARRIGSW